MDGRDLRFAAMKLFLRNLFIEHESLSCSECEGCTVSSANNSEYSELCAMPARERELLVDWEVNKITCRAAISLLSPAIERYSFNNTSSTAGH